MPLKKTLEIHNMMVVVRSVFHEDNKYHLQVLLEECLHKLYMLKYGRIYVSNRIDVNKTNDSHKRIICNYWYFFEINCTFDPNVCNDCHDLMS